MLSPLYLVVQRLLDALSSLDATPESVVFDPRSLRPRVERSCLSLMRVVPADLLFDWFRQCPLIAETHPQPAGYRPSVNAKLFGPFSDRECSSVEREIDVVSPVYSLLPWRRPAAVVGSVVSIIVNAVKPHAFWPRMHVLNERPEGVPSLTDCDSPASVSMIARALRVSTPVSHVRPACEQRMIGNFHNALSNGAPDSVTQARRTVGARIELSGAYQRATCVTHELYPNAASGIDH